MEVNVPKRANIQHLTLECNMEYTNNPSLLYVNINTHSLVHIPSGQIDIHQEFKFAVEIPTIAWIKALFPTFLRLINVKGWLNFSRFLPKIYLIEENSQKFPISNVQIQAPKKFQIISNSDTEGKTSNYKSHTSPMPNNQPPKLSPSPPPQESRRQFKFEIIEIQPPYSPREAIKPNIQINHSNTSDFRENQANSHNSDPQNPEFYITKAAFEGISQHIGWGQNTDENVFEQGGILLGEAFHDPNTGILYAITQQAIPAKLAKGTPTYLKVTHQAWKEMLDDVDRLNSGLQVIGWYHTHPNNLDVFMSGVDKATQSSLFGNDWQFAIVLNPQKQIWRVFFGSKSHECKGYILDTDSQLYFPN